ncbi:MULTISPECIES: hypothetical protein [Chryseobacterium]|uniref:Uncharacterized protein n=1 Tax=Chryseobacterium camelliae TaxID=1265445 RepID=A0ABU0TNL8_9FLAO|nr:MULTISPECIES: hypothetical protein [Chryseobacterium]MDT3407576.1 hypothetical protein [Pseudacidovorax intermedius]MDQ1098571.1 hypothetical protein [Chryseobacterium camelliae]MDQ1102495.1 hypothetical protein [Chryseobacterium sp. SORGH_AS_1048]MDR6085929.1 hypothetical protein [Chryseobacterium sp. SORGH_AS_0909]MDR6130295.1 hypothetical protein [Chryseobacterium sp. SORGH_AS_1175]
MFKDILGKPDQEQLAIAEQYRKYYNFHIEDFKTEYENYFDIVDKDASLKALDYARTYQLFGYNKDEISIYIRKKIESFYLCNISNFIVKKEEFAIYSFIDIFYCDPLFFQNKENLKIFFDVTYPILFVETENMSSFIAIACTRYIAILGSQTEGKTYLERYLYENDKGIYIEDVREEL